MAKHALTPKAVYDSEVANTIESAASDYFQSQPWWDKRKNTLGAIAQGILQAANVGAYFLTGQDYPLWVVLIIGVVISIAQATVTAVTAAPVTPRNTEKLVAHADRKDRERRSSIADYYESAS